MSKASDKYLRRVRRRLFASKETREHLLRGLGAELAEAGDVGYEELVKRFGSPEDVAGELQSSVNEAEAYSARSKSRRIAVILGVVAVVLVVTLAAYVWYVMSSEALTYSQEITEITDFPY